MEEATFIIGISQGHDIEFIVGSMPSDDSVEQGQFSVGDVPKDVMWSTTVVRVRGTRQQCVVVFNALASAFDECEPEFRDDE